MNWRGDAACGARWGEEVVLGARSFVIDHDLFFPDDEAKAAAAKKVCRDCPVRRPCLDYAMNNNERHGIWGGLTRRERRLLRRKYPAA